MKNLYLNGGLTRILLLTAVLTVLPAAALDISTGGDALYHQLYPNPIVVAARFTNKTEISSSFSLIKLLSGKNMPTNFAVPLSDDYLKDFNFVSGQTYLLFLKANVFRPIPRVTAPTIALPERLLPLPPERPRPIPPERPFPVPELPISYGFMSSIYSIQTIADAEVAEIDFAVQTYKNNAGNLGALKVGLKGFAISNSPYLQYSSMSDLSQMSLLNSADVGELAQHLAQGRIKYPRAQVLLLREIAKNNLIIHANTLEDLVKRNDTHVSVQVAAFDALSDMNALENLRRLEPVLRNHKSLRLQARLIKRGPLK